MSAAQAEIPTLLPEGAPKAARREVRYEHSLNLGSILSRFGISLLVSTYQAVSSG